MGFGFWGFVFCVLCLGFCVLGFRFWGLCLGFWILCFVFVFCVWRFFFGVLAKKSLRCRIKAPNFKEIPWKADVRLPGKGTSNFRSN